MWWWEVFCRLVFSFWSGLVCREIFLGKKKSNRTPGVKGVFIPLEGRPKPKRDHLEAPLGVLIFSEYHPLNLENDWTRGFMILRSESRQYCSLGRYLLWRWFRSARPRSERSRGQVVFAYATSLGTHLAGETWLFLMSSLACTRDFTPSFVCLSDCQHDALVCTYLLDAKQCSIYSFYR